MDPAEKEIESCKALNQWLNELQEAEKARRSVKWGSRLVIDQNQLKYQSGLLSIFKRTKFQDIAEFCSKHRIVEEGLTARIKQYNKTAKKDQQIQSSLVSELEHLEEIWKEVFHIFEPQGEDRKLTAKELKVIKHLRNAEGHTVFHEAIVHGNTEIIRQLRQKYPEQFKSELAEVVKQVAVSRPNPELYQTVLPTVLRFGDRELLKKMMIPEWPNYKPGYRITLDFIYALMEAPEDTQSDLIEILEVKSRIYFQIDITKIFSDLLLAPRNIDLLTFLQNQQFVEFTLEGGRILLDSMNAHMKGAPEPEKIQAKEIFDILIKQLTQDPKLLKKIVSEGPVSTECIDIILEKLSAIPTESSQNIVRLYDSLKDAVFIDNNWKLRMAILLGYDVPNIHEVSQNIFEAMVKEYFPKGGVVTEEPTQIGLVEKPKYAVVTGHEIGIGAYKVATAAISIISQRGQDVQIEEEVHLSSIRSIRTKADFAAAVREIEIIELLKSRGVPNIASFRLCSALNKGKAIKPGEQFEQGVSYEISLVGPVCRGNLFDLLKRDKQQGRLHDLDAIITRLEFVRGALQALKGAHKNDVIHGDIKPENILLPLKGTGGLLSDFGHSVRKNKDDARRPGYGTELYEPPEFRGLLTPEADVFASANIIKEMFDGTRFTEDLYSKFTYRDYDRVKEECSRVRETLKDSQSEFDQAKLGIYECLNSLLVPEGIRPTIDVALELFEKTLDVIIDRRNKAKEAIAKSAPAEAPVIVIASAAKTPAPPKAQ